MSEELPSSLIRRIASAIATLPWEPWRLPVEEQLSEMGDLLDDPMPESWKSWERNLPQLRYYLSATSQAIRFLDRLSAPLRLQLRHVVLHKDKKSVALPECHTFGLILYVNTLSSLRIERRVDLWSTV
jgi:hypothetical protein